VVADRLGLGPADTVRPVFAQWRAVVGDAMAAHVRPMRMEGATLVVSADDPAWAAQVRHLSAEILRRLAGVCAAATVPTHLRVLVRPHRRP